MEQIAMEKKEIVNQTTFCYTIDDIANWQKEISTTTAKYKISLPSLQRGFVWKVSQIESLWDSLLRGYPIGSLLMNKVTEDKKELLDGQQRSTSISIAYLNSFNTDNNTKLFNIQRNIPTVWIDIQPIENSAYGLKFGLRVLTRSHPWGYQLKDNTKTLAARDREHALAFFREKADDEHKSFSDLEHDQINPWDAHYPIPLFVLLTSNMNSFEVWRGEVKSFVESRLTQKIKTKHSAGKYVDYTSVNELHLKRLYNAIKKAKQTLIPEILIHQEALEEEEEHVHEDSDEATLFVRLNSEGTRVSGEELIYSLLKSTFPQAKELVEKIDVKYIAPSKIVNLFARLTQMELQDKPTFQKNMNLIGFRRGFAKQEFRELLKAFILEDEDGVSEAKKLFDKTMEVVSFKADLPKIYVKSQVSKSLDLFFVLMVYLHKNEEITEDEKATLHKDFHSMSLFNSDAKKTAKALFDVLNLHDFKNWSKSVDKLRKEQPFLVYPIISSEDFKRIHNLILNQYLKDRSHSFNNWDYLRSIFKSNQKEIKFLQVNKSCREEETLEEFENRILDEATSHWTDFANKIYWGRTFLLLAQKEYFNSEFKDFMEFDDIEDTNKPWDWDHIYPNSWVYKKTTSPLVKHVVNTNGNFRALSFNENRSQSNHESPKFRFENNTKAQQGSFVKENDLEHWLQLSNDDTRLKNSDKFKNKVDAFVCASFYRMNNIYEVVFSLFQH